jgi:hypothetical protein
MNTTTRTYAPGTIGQGTAVHAMIVGATTVKGDALGPMDVCGQSFYRNGRPQRKRVIGTDLAEVTCLKCLKALAA